MTRCLTCNSLLTKEETVCMGCGTQIHNANPSPGIAETLSKAINILFWISGITTIACLFIPDTPPVSRPIIVTVALGLIKRSADAMVEKTSEKKH
jgi:hypothetical protein